MNQTYQPTCSKCSSPTNYRSGIGKESGKPYAGYFCTNPQCKNVDFVQGTPMGAGNPPPPAPPPQGIQKPPPPNGDKDWEVINKKKQDAILWGQACNKAVDLVTSGVLPAEPGSDPYKVALHIADISGALYAQFIRVPRITTDMMAGRDPGPQQPPPGY